ncbi:3-hydroxyacyl-CoA dehydrogenase NAD-binding domain-containing protein [Xanthobacter sp. TB0139]|uniref:3-hydroxyacyl-CoA dehydrogenase NAD-binding domain-containing protein n=1 Tax=Xanthobacter sp. TB0139 TaxID=3459178 RepID=UPI0040399176
MPVSSQPETIAVIGVGVIGSSWVSLFLAAGLKVRANDPAPGAEERLRAFVANAWPALENLGQTKGLTLEAAQAALSFHARIEDAATGAQFVQENAPERLEIKRETYARLEAGLADDAIIASSTSGIMPSALQELMTRPERFLVGHPFNPPHLIPLVEVVPGKQTTEACVEAATAFYRAIGKTPIRLHKEVVGHVANRLQGAIWREAVYLAQQGVASVEDIDLAVSAGPGQRWAIMGPSMTFNLGGGRGGMAHFLEHLGPAVETWWADLGAPHLDEATQKMLADAFDRLDDAQFEKAIQHRDKALLRRLRALAEDAQD